MNGSLDQKEDRKQQSYQQLNWDINYWVRYVYYSSEDKKSPRKYLPFSNSKTSQDCHLVNERESCSLELNPFDDVRAYAFRISIRFLSSFYKKKPYFNPISLFLLLLGDRFQRHVQIGKIRSSHSEKERTTSANGTIIK